MTRKSNDRTTSSRRERRSFFDDSSSGISADDTLAPNSSVHGEDEPYTGRGSAFVDPYEFEALSQISPCEAVPQTSSVKTEYVSSEEDNQNAEWEDVSTSACSNIVSQISCATTTSLADRDPRQKHYPDTPSSFESIDAGYSYIDPQPQPQANCPPSVHGTQPGGRSPPYPEYQPASPRSAYKNTDARYDVYDEHRSQTRLPPNDIRIRLSRDQVPRQEHQPGPSRPPSGSTEDYDPKYQARYPSSIRERQPRDRGPHRRYHPDRSRPPSGSTDVYYSIYNPESQERDSRFIRMRQSEDLGPRQRYQQGPSRPPSKSTDICFSYYDPESQERDPRYMQTRTAGDRDPRQEYQSRPLRSCLKNTSTRYASELQSQARPPKTGHARQLEDRDSSSAGYEAPISQALSPSPRTRAQIPPRNEQELFLRYHFMHLDENGKEVWVLERKYESVDEYPKYVVRSGPTLGERVNGKGKGALESAWIKEWEWDMQWTIDV
ncbi:hypothetical protein SBOR_5521 [Sclerotinia borealis F-4128]|uniref:Uncharacterized protein n=1 Tax=Sclerotinia borealis (strain F-4128) TaxID=1432307 RepID=W9CE08_SCLBF|nr:hypothetical protein SBOR_5521 [Sclerotinia borealis F-4128]